MKFSKINFLRLMKFPEMWLDWGMYPDTLAEIQFKCYEPGHEKSSEHFRFGAFCWWEKNIQSKEELKKLLELSYLDIDQGMATQARERMKALPLFDRTWETTR
jgi:hypothetical protein